MSDPRLQELFDAPHTADEPPMPAGFAQGALARGRRRVRHRRAVRAVATGGVAAVAALAVGGVVALGGGAPGGPDRPPAAAGTGSPAKASRPTTATALLHQASLASYDRQVTVRPDQYIYVSTLGKHREPTAEADNPDLHGDAESDLRGVETQVRTVRMKTWTSANGRRGWGWNDSPKAPRDGSKYRTAAVPHPTLDEPTYEYLKTLPTDPDALLRRVRAAAQATADQKPGQQKLVDYLTFEDIEQLLRVQVLPSRLAGALYTDLGRIEGVTLVPDIADAAGRHGVGVAMSDPLSHIRTTIILNKKSYEYLGDRRDDRDGRFLDWTAVLDTRVVNSVD
ncbi:hypothetical protein Athai_07020 [Actinocatenispora thailandica]|uniref:CU044_5270 family protein n=1 Tax=Actinocatenispora thailandica TaxID=227318 RepID=A0A7R7HVS2_9ACTN|nr:CU044_5270 family protein [Actinocatenispora thailandica]BCJ33199.1 hypothetical protein Athai_07020 [Actinocatenispora thailandica]